MLVFASAVADPERYRRCALSGIRSVAEPDSVVVEVETSSIFDGYNEVLDAFRDEPALEALVLMHDDVEIVDPRFCEKVRRRMAEPGVGVVGVAGARGVTSLAWWEGDCRGRVRETRGLLDWGGGVHDVDCVDGLMLILSPAVVRTVRFDAERFSGFHAYDVDYCFEARAAGLRVLVDELDVVHQTKGGFGDKAVWDEADRIWRSKWAIGSDLSPAIAS